MATTSYKDAYLPAVAGDSGVWGGYLNSTLDNSTFAVFDANLGGLVAKGLTSSNVTLTAVESQNLVVRLTGTLSASVQITTECQGFHIVENLCTLGSYAVTMKNDTAAGTVTVPYGRWVVIFDDNNGARLVSDNFPAGAISVFAGSSAPTGWLLCYGQAISRTTYAVLFSALGTTYGIGDGSTTFNVPDLRGRTIFGLDNMGGSAASRLTGTPSGSITTPTTLGSTGGEEGHSVTEAETGQHDHTASVTDSHYHLLFNSDTSSSNVSGSTYPAYRRYDDERRDYTTSGTSTTPTYGKSSGTNGTLSVSVANAGSGTSHNTIPPAIVMNWIIKY